MTRHRRLTKNRRAPGPINPHRFSIVPIKSSMNNTSEKRNGAKFEACSAFWQLKNCERIPARFERSDGPPSTSPLLSSPLVSSPTEKKRRRKEKKIWGRRKRDGARRLLEAIITVIAYYSRTGVFFFFRFLFFSRHRIFHRQFPTFLCAGQWKEDDALRYFCRTKTTRFAVFGPRTFVEQLTALIRYLFQTPRVDFV